MHPPPKQKNLQNGSRKRAAIEAAGIESRRKLAQLQPPLRVVPEIDVLRAPPQRRPRLAPPVALYCHVLDVCCLVISRSPGSLATRATALLLVCICFANQIAHCYERKKLLLLQRHAWHQPCTYHMYYFFVNIYHWKGCWVESCSGKYITCMHYDRPV